MSNLIAVEVLAQLNVTVLLFQSAVSFYSYGLHSGLALMSWDLVSSREFSNPTS